MAKPNSTPQNEAPTGRVPAPVQKPSYVNPRNKRTGRYAAGGVPMSRKWPDVRGGVCEWCGVIDPNTPSQFQYKLCEHYRGLQLACDYCGGQRDQDDNIYHSTFLIHDHPDNPDLLVIRCNSYKCVEKHEQRFKVGV